MVPELLWKQQYMHVQSEVKGISMRSKPLRHCPHLRWQFKQAYEISSNPKDAIEPQKKTELITRFLANDCSTNGLKNMIGMYGFLDLRP